jgi:hypothetical protein
MDAARSLKSLSATVGESKKAGERVVLETVDAVGSDECAGAVVMSLRLLS